MFYFRFKQNNLQKKNQCLFAIVSCYDATLGNLTYWCSWTQCDSYIVSHQNYSESILPIIHYFDPDGYCLWGNSSTEVLSHCKRHKEYQTVQVKWIYTYYTFKQNIDARPALFLYSLFISILFPLLFLLFPFLIK